MEFLVVDPASTLKLSGNPYQPKGEISYSALDIDINLLNI